MSSMPWIKVYTDIIDDHKIGRLAIPERWRFVALCVLAGECDAEGYLANGHSAMTIEDIAWRLREDPDELQESMVLLKKAGLLCQDEDGAWFVTNFSKRQGRPQYEKRKQWRERKQRQRNREEDEGEQGIEQEQARNPEDVTRDSRVSPTHRVEESRVEKEESKSRGDNAGKPAAVVPDGLTEGQRLFLAAFGAKRFRTNPQKAAVLELEKQYGTDRLNDGVQWAAKQGMNMGKAVIALETALKKWGRAKGDAVKVSGL